MDRRLTTIVAADLAGFSRLMAADEEGVIRRLREARAEIIDPAVRESGGRIIKTMGDGLLLEFPSPVDCVRAMIAVQDQITARETGPENQRLRFRVGVNLGDIVEDGDDILGDGVNVAARLESLAPPGGICISRSVFDQLRGKIDRPTTALGPQMVKNIPEPVEVWRIEIAGAAAPVVDEIRASIAVLPFQNLSSDPEQEFLADGIVEDVVTELSRFRSLFVIARNSTSAYKNAAKDVRQIARELGARYVVEGSVRRSGQRLRLTAQLIDAETGVHLWAERWDRTIDDLFDLQDELTRAIVTGVEPELGAHERALARNKPVESLTVWELCHRGDDWQARIDLERFAECEALFRRALSLDPQSARAHVMLARLMVSRVLLGMTDDAEGALAETLSLARRAVELDDRDDMAYYILSMALSAAGDYSAAMEATDRGLALNVNNSRLYYGRVFCLLVPPLDASTAEAIAADLAEAERLSPTDPMIVHFRAVAGNAWLCSDAPDAEQRALEAYEGASRRPNALWFHSLVAAALRACRGDREMARDHIATTLRRKPDASLAVAPDAQPNAHWKASWQRVARIADDLVELGLPRD